MYELMDSIDLEEIISQKQWQRFIHKSYKVNDIVYREGESPQGLFFLKKGLLALTYISKNGTESLLRIFTQGTFFGHRSFLVQQSYHATATVLQDSEVIFIEDGLAKEVLETNSKLLFKITQIMAKELKNAENRLRDMVGKRAFQRVIESLIYLKHQTPDHPWTRKEMGEFCGVKTETVSRSLGQLEELGLISRNGRYIHIIDREKLLAHLNDAP